MARQFSFSSINLSVVGQFLISAVSPPTNGIPASNEAPVPKVDQ